MKKPNLGGLVPTYGEPETGGRSRRRCWNAVEWRKRRCLILRNDVGLFVGSGGGASKRDVVGSYWRCVVTAIT